MKNNQLENSQEHRSRRQLIATLGITGATALAGLAVGKGSSPAYAAAVEGKVLTLSLDDLRKLKNPQVGMIYFLSDPGRQGIFLYAPKDRTTPDNGGTILVGQDGARFKRSYDGALNAQWFGALGDGKTDDAPALIKALRCGAQSGEVVYIPRTTAGYSIASTVRVPLETGQQLIVESNGALIKPVVNFKSDTLWRLTMYDEQMFLSFGKTGEGKQLSPAVHTAFGNNLQTSVTVRGLVIDSSAIPIVANTLKAGAPDWSIKFGVGLQISAENVVIENCRFQNIFGYGTRVHGPKNVYAANNVYHEVGGRGNTPHLKVDMDSFGDGLYMSSIKGNGQIVVTDCIFQGITSLPFRSRIAITYEYGDEIYNSIVSNCTFSRYAKSIHIEEKVPSDIKIENCLFRDMNFGIANVINDNGRCVVNSCKFLITNIDDHDFGSPLFLLNYRSNCAVFFNACEIHLNTSGATWQAIVGAHLFNGCSFHGYKKNHFFADANAHFTNCWFYDFGGQYQTFYSGSSHSYLLQNCDFTGDTIRAASEKARLTFINCRHHTPGKQLLGNHMQNLGGVFPNFNNECTEFVLAGNVDAVTEKTCPSPLWQSVSKILVLVLKPDAPFQRGAAYQSMLLSCDTEGKWTADAEIRELKGQRVVLAPAHYAEYLE